MRFQFIAKHRGAWPVGWLCEALGVSRGGFYEWLQRPPSRRSRENDQLKLTVQIRTSFERSDRTYGSLRVVRDLHEWGFACSRNRVVRLMQAAGIKARHKRRRLPTDQGVRPEHSIAPNLLDRSFEATAPNQRWVADFTYIWTAENWLYFAVVLDLSDGVSSRHSIQSCTSWIVSAATRAITAVRSEVMADPVVTV